MSFEDGVFAELAAASPAQRLLAVVRCERSERLSRGTRSERAVHHAVITAMPRVARKGDDSAALATGDPIVLTRYAQGPDPLARGMTYLVAATRDEYAPAFTLLGAVAIEAGSGKAELDAALQELVRREVNARRR